MTFQPARRVDDWLIPRSPVMAIAGEGPALAAVNDEASAIPVMLDMNPAFSLMWAIDQRQELRRNVADDANGVVDGLVKRAQPDSAVSSRVPYETK